MSIFPDTEGWGAYQRHRASTRREGGKHNAQQLERKSRTLRACIKRLTRRTLCCSKSVQRHDLVIGVFINRHEFGANV